MPRATRISPRRGAVWPEISAACWIFRQESISSGVASPLRMHHSPSVSREKSGRRILTVSSDFFVKVTEAPYLAWRGFVSRSILFASSAGRILALPDCLIAMFMPKFGRKKTRDELSEDQEVAALMPFFMTSLGWREVLNRVNC